jgi:hypothetical protein
MRIRVYSTSFVELGSSSYIGFAPATVVEQTVFPLGPAFLNLDLSRYLWNTGNTSSCASTYILDSVQILLDIEKRKSLYETSLKQNTKCINSLQTDSVGNTHKQSKQRSSRTSVSTARRTGSSWSRRTRPPMTTRLT